MASTLSCCLYTFCCCCCNFPFVAQQLWRPACLARRINQRSSELGQLSRVTANRTAFSARHWALMVFVVVAVVGRAAVWLRVCVCHRQRKLIRTFHFYSLERYAPGCVCMLSATWRLIAVQHALPRCCCYCSYAVLP